MSTSTSRTASPSTSRDAGPVKALVAAGASPAGRRTLDGELVWIPLPCGRVECSCIVDFEGVVTRGITDVARVQTFTEVGRSSVRRAIAAGMCTDCVPPSLAPSRAEWLLRAAEDLPDGTLVRRDRSGGFRPWSPGERSAPDGSPVGPEGER